MFLPAAPKAKQAPPATAAPGTPARVVTSQDVARYLPAVAALHAEPDGWAVVGVPANFWVDVRPVVVEGTLLDERADVRFTPTAYHWDYGDGTQTTTATPGASWADLGQEELTATATSHRYAARGRVSATVQVAYHAEYRIAQGAWTDVDGAVVGEAPPLPVLVVRERTVLTNGNEAGAG